MVRGNVSCVFISCKFNYGVSGGIWPKFELIEALMHVLVTCNNEDD